MNCFHLCAFLYSLENHGDEIKVKLFCPKRNFDSIIELKNAYLVTDSFGDDVVLLSSDDSINEKFREFREMYKNDKKN